MKFASLDLRNPLLIASGPATATIGQLEQAAAHGAAGVSIKHAMSRQQKPGRLRCYSEPEGVLIFPSDRRLDVEEAADLVRQARWRTDLVVMVNFSSQEGDLASYGRLARVYEEAGAHAVEINMCCPNFGLADDRPDLADVAPGALTGQSPDLAAAVVETVRGAVSIPVVAKLTPTAPDLAEVARRCEKAGADALSLVGGPSLAAPPVDIRDRGRPLYPLMGRSAFGAITGSAIRYNTFRVVAQVAEVVSIPITASGGIDTWEHAVQMMMWGASSVGVCSAVMWRGFEAARKMIDGMDRFMEEQGYGGYEELVGLSLRYLGASTDMEFCGGFAAVDPDRCRDCGICLKPAHCDAVARVEGKAVVDPELCVGCGICASLCPYDAIEMKAR
jgi:dihydroorotate dehydrogenase/Pyruvate/2-oxoacid:ferredoxin oxidoreductase delta subunit